jgi:hypothetical protein
MVISKNYTQKGGEEAGNNFFFKTKKQEDKS